MPYKTIFLIALLIIAAAGYFLFVQGGNHIFKSNKEIKITARYRCADGKAIAVGYGENFANVRLSDNREFTLEKSVTSTGQRYSSEDDAIVLINFERAAYLQENGTVTFRECNEAAESKDNGRGAIERAIVAYPELARYRTQTLPPVSIQTEETTNGWNIAFIENGSGISAILTAQCYFVSNTGLVRPIGGYKKTGDEDMKKIIPSSCQALP